jgi:hypothetical protein
MILVPIGGRLDMNEDRSFSICAVGLGMKVINAEELMVDVEEPRRTRMDSKAR